MTDPFYNSAAWKALRLATLKRDRFACVLCGRSVARKGESRVDHKLPRSSHRHLELDPDNVRTLCVVCDNKRHREKGGTGSARTAETGPAAVGADGFPLDSEWS